MNKLLQEVLDSLNPEKLLEKVEIKPLYDSKLLKDISPEELLDRMHDRLLFHANRNRQRINGYDFDDIFQELSMELWNKLPKLPPEIDKFDYRFLRYMDRCFFTCIGQLYRKKCTFTKGDYKIKDGLDRKIDIDINLF